MKTFPFIWPTSEGWKEEKKILHPYHFFVQGSKFIKYRYIVFPDFLHIDHKFNLYKFHCFRKGNSITIYNFLRSVVL